MDNKINKVLVESAIKKGISDIKDDPQRGIRNLIDLGAYFIKDKFQKNILDVFHKIFNNPKSPYFDMFKNLVRDVDEKILKTFSFNLGYNSLTNGAKVIRENKEIYKCYIPWIINFNLKDQNEDSLRIDDIIKIVDEGKTLGIYSYMFFIDKDIDFLFPLLEKEKDSAFFLMTEKDSINKKELDKINSFKNTYISISMEYKDIKSELLKNTLNLLKGSGALHGVHSYYNHKNAAIIATNRWKRNLRKLNLNSAFLIESNPKDYIANDKIKHFTEKSRKKKNFKTFLVNYLKDITFIQNSISKDKSYLEIDSLGNLKISSNAKSKNFNLKTNSLIESLMLSMSNFQL